MYACTVNVFAGVLQLPTELRLEVEAQLHILLPVSMDSKAIFFSVEEFGDEQSKFDKHFWLR